ncbi:hypothetical protein K491DRAFT_252544 [Lophiostoma macrostomum CBS 122681]|uniref:Argonaute linker 1 domain-containing protein n=1 Tax=Lophiostoma macrostomum CBS 122681 TaxID=1314788 RepID=A0A6A6THC5_9PLEO|nr:hypothetical protein K491DRAFT_252544 [Lophiostoma macrostomum CBS 122681]
MAIPSSKFDNRKHFGSKQTKQIFQDAKEEREQSSEDLEVHCLRPEFAEDCEVEENDTTESAEDRLEPTEHAAAIDSTGTVLTNHFKLDFADKDFHQYEVLGMRDSEDRMPSREGRRKLMQDFIASCEQLCKERESFEDDGLSLIVSWKDLRESFGLADAENGATLFEKEMTSRDEKDKRTLTLEYRGIVPTVQLLEASKGFTAHFAVEPQDTISADRAKRTISAEHAVNIIIAKSAKASHLGVFQIGRNKFFVDDKRLNPKGDPSKIDLQSGYVAYKGFTFTTKVGMGAPLLNISLATSAFFQPLYVDEFLKESDYDYDALIGTKVKVKYSGITRTIRGFGDSRPQKQMFDFKGSEVSVYEYLRDRKQIDGSLLERIAMSQFPCANVKSDNDPEWFPVEALKILKHQPVKRISGDLTSQMIYVARSDPGPNIHRIFETGLPTLGLNSQDTEGSSLKSSGISFSNEVLEIPARQLSIPHVRYGNLTIQPGARGEVWDLKAPKKFLDTHRSFTGRIMVLVPQHIHSNDDKKTLLQKKMELMVE